MSKKLIPFNNGDAWFQLSTKGKVYTLRNEKDKYNGIHEVSVNGKPQGFHVIVTLVKSVQITGRGSAVHCEPFNDLDSYAIDSGFISVEDWMSALTSFSYNIPTYPKTRPFNLYLCTRLKGS
jgi:hypothetical protein